jgi:carbamoyl-phosphate synthase small subunit
MPHVLPAGTTGLLALADGEIFPGIGLGQVDEAVGEVCFNTAMTGYQEILTDPSYMGQIVTFTFPHIGNVGTNEEDVEHLGGAHGAAARGAIFRDTPTAASNWRSGSTLDAWLADRGVVGLAGIDTRALTRRIRESGMPHGVIAHSPSGVFDIAALVARARDWAGLAGADLALPASSVAGAAWSEGLWAWGEGYAHGTGAIEVVVVDYGVKRNILRALTAAGANVHVVPAQTSAADILARKPHGVVLANGPGDPAATARWAGSEIRALVESGVPIFGICLGHQLLALSLGAETVKMEQGHHGANHPVKDLATGKVEIVSMNHGFTVRRETLPDRLEETHVSLFDGSNAGLKVNDVGASTARRTGLTRRPSGVDLGLDLGRARGLGRGGLAGRVSLLRRRFQLDRAALGESRFERGEKLRRVRLLLGGSGGLQPPRVLQEILQGGITQAGDFFDQAHGHANSALKRGKRIDVGIQRADCKALGENRYFTLRPIDRRFNVRGIEFVLVRPLFPNLISGFTGPAFRSSSNLIFQRGVALCDASASKDWTEIWLPVL